MDPVLAEIYSTVIPSAPYIIAAYALLWVALLVYVFMIMRGVKRASERMSLIEEELADRKERSAREVADRTEDR